MSLGQNQSLMIGVEVIKCLTVEQELEREGG